MKIRLKILHNRKLIHCFKMLINNNILWLLIENENSVKIFQQTMDCQKLKKLLNLMTFLNPGNLRNQKLFPQSYITF